MVVGLYYLGLYSNIQHRFFSQRVYFDPRTENTNDEESEREGLLEDKEAKPRSFSYEAALRDKEERPGPLLLRISFYL